MDKLRVLIVEDDQLVEAVRHPRRLIRLMPELLRQSAVPGAGLGQRLSAWRTVIATIGRVAADQWLSRWDPLRTTRSRLGRGSAAEVEARARAEVDAAVRAALDEIGVGP